MLVSLPHLQAFLAVARNRSFSIAARELSTTQPHVSNQIRGLEQHYGVPLFVRSKGHITLTEAGETLSVRAQTVLSEISDTERELREFRRLDRGTVRIAATSSVGNHLLPGLVADFRRGRPQITVIAEVDNTERVWEMVENDEAELAITTPHPPPNRKLVTEPFVHDELVVIAAADVDLPDPLRFDDLAAQPLVLREEGSLTLEVMREVLGGHDYAVAVQLRGTAAVNEAVAAGAGISLVPLSSIGAWQAAGTITVRSLRGPRLQHEYVLAHSTARFQTSAAQALLAFLRTWAAQHPTTLGTR